jgi:drug/metabolite transporter (DMT)-like permease
MILAVVLGVVAAFLFALSAFLQQRAARETVGGHTVSLRESADVKRLAHRLPRSRTWLRGWGANLCGWGTQAAALQVGSVAAVQPLMSTQLLFVLSLASASQRRWPQVRDWLAVLAVCGGLILFLSTEGASPLNGHPRRPNVLLATACALALVTLLVLVSRVCAGWLASMLVGVAAGTCHAMNAVFIKMTLSDLLDRGVAATAVDWPGYALAASTAAGLLLGQLAFASGALPPAVASISVTNPIVSVAVGLLAFDAPIPDTPGALAAIAASGVLVALGITGLANASSTRQMYAAAHAVPDVDAALPHRRAGGRDISSIRCDSEEHAR